MTRVPTCSRRWLGIAARLIPDDGDGVGAIELGVIGYIARSLTEERASFAVVCSKGVAALDRHAAATSGIRFAELTPATQDGLLRELEEDRAPWFGPGASDFFELIRDLVIEGTFSDPRWGGNAGCAGWSLIGYPGPRFVWTEEDQRIQTISEETR